jgi:predicted peroxiredoxin
MEKIINLLIKEFIEGVDTYTHNGSTWLIFTENKQWVIEITEEKTLWYNYNFFKEIFEYASMDVVENQHHITKWVENNIIKDAKEIISDGFNVSQRLCEDVIENGVKHTEIGWHQYNNIDDAIENGVKETITSELRLNLTSENIIKNGVKRTLISPTHTEYGDWLDGDERLDEIIKNGVKKTSPLDPSFSVRFIDGDENNDWEKVPNINEVINNGIKETHDDVYHHKGRIDGVIKNGVKETKTPGVNGDLLSTFQWMVENNTKSVPKMIDDVIENGIKETKTIGKDSPNYPKMVISDIINNGVKVSGTFVGGKRQKEDVESVIGYGTKNPTG